MKTNKARHLPPVKTHEGAPASRINHEQQLQRSVLACLLWEDEFYESGVEIAKRIFDTASLCSPDFVGSLALRARNEHNLRHVPLLLLLNLIMRRAPNTANYIYGVISRVDELTELVSMYFKMNKKPKDSKSKRTNVPLSAQMKHGLARAFDKFDEYQFAKWDSKYAEVKLRDVLRLVRPKPKNPEQEALFKRIKEGSLARPDTWESRAAAGEPLKDVFTDLLTRNKLGYLALLRNLRKMTELGVDDQLVRKALRDGKTDRVLPFRFIAAARHAPMFERELDAAMQRTMLELPKLPGRTILLVDVSGSMDMKLSAKSDLRRCDAAGGLAVLVSGVCEQARVFIFGDSVREVPPRQGMALAELCVAKNESTYLGEAVDDVNTLPHDRLIVITDEQSHTKVGAPKQKGYMINVASNRNGVGYGPWVHIDGFSEACVKYMMAAEKDGLFTKQ
jgi:60 kDa SS-A/Ro ribonucleoprotein